MRQHALESKLERLMKYGTIICSLLIATGILLEAFNDYAFDLVTAGIIGFIALPVLRQVAMLISYISVKDIPMARVVSIGLTLVIAGLILGIVW